MRFDQLNKKDEITLSTILSEDNRKNFLKKLCKDLAILEVYCFEEGTLKDEFFDVQEKKGNYIITLSESGIDFFGEIGEVVAFARAKEDFVYKELFIEKVKKAVEKYNRLTNSSLNINSFNSLDKEVNIEYIQEIISTLENKKSKTKKSHIEETLVKKLKEFLEKYHKRIERLNNLPGNYSSQVFQGDQYSFLESSFKAHLNNIQGNEFSSYTVPIPPSLLQGITIKTISKIDSVNQSLLKILQDRGDKLNTEKLNWLLENKTLTFFSLFLILSIVVYSNRQHLEEYINEEVFTFRSIGGIKGKKSVDNSEEMNDGTGGTNVSPKLYAERLLIGVIDEYVKTLGNMSIDIPKNSLYTQDDIDNEFDKKIRSHFQGLLNKYGFRLEISRKNRGENNLIVTLMFHTQGNIIVSKELLVETKKIPK